MRLSRDGRFASEERPRSCLVKGGGLWLLRQGNLGCCCSDVMRGVGGKAVRRVGLCFMWSVL